jgi:hypothetical protein
VERLRRAKALLENADLLRMREELKAADASLLEALQQQVLFQAGLTEGTEGAAAGELVTQLSLDWERLAGQIEPFEKAAKERLLILLSLLRTPAMAACLEHTQQLQEEVHDLIHVFAALSFAFPPLLLLRQQFAKLQALLPHRTSGVSELFDAVLQNEAAEARRLLEEVQKALGATAYPFKHVKHNISMVDFARTKEFAADPVLMALKETESHLQMLFAVYFQLLGRLTAIASQVESQLANAA